MSQILGCLFSLKMTLIWSATLKTEAHALVTLLKGNCVNIIGKNLNTSICKCFIRALQFIQRINPSVP